MATDDEKLYQRNVQIAVNLCNRVTGYLRQDENTQLMAVMLTGVISNHIEREFTTPGRPLPEIVIEKVNRLNQTARLNGFGPLVDID